MIDYKKKYLKYKKKYLNLKNKLKGGAPESFYKYDSRPNEKLDEAREHEDNLAAVRGNNIRRLPSFRKNLPMKGPSEAAIENLANDLDRETFKEVSEGDEDEAVDKEIDDVESTPEWWAAYRTDFNNSYKEPGSHAHTEYGKTYYRSDNEDFDEDGFSDARVSPFED